MPQDQFAAAFGWSARLYVASLTAFVVGQFIDIALFQVFRRLTGDKLLWLRATGSTAVSQAVDTLIVNFVLLVDTKSVAFILTTVTNSYLVKLVIALGLTPLIYLARNVVLRYVLVEDARPFGVRAS
jgi:uncharacterized integral membrane protein (TIGR00697 family)